jgi:hypothetical protein
MHAKARESLRRSSCAVLKRFSIVSELPVRRPVRASGAHMNRRGIGSMFWTNTLLVSLGLLFAAGVWIWSGLSPSRSGIPNARAESGPSACTSGSVPDHQGP